MPNFDKSNPHLSLVITGERSCTGTITNPYKGWYETFSIVPGVSTEISIPCEQAYDLEASDQILNNAIHVTASDSISLYASNFYGYTFDITNVLPTSACGSEYILQTYSNPSSNYSEFKSAVSIIAIEDNTTINITLKSNSLNNEHYANYTYSITLNTGQCYQIKSITGGDFSGSTITANDNKKIAVFAGNTAAQVPNGEAAADHIVEQMMPTSCWGKNFIVTNSKMRTKDRVRVTALNNNCQIRKDGNLLTTINAKQTYEFEITDSKPAIYLETSEPASVFLYLTGADYGGAMGDPSMVIISPIEQRIDNVTFSSFQTELSEYHFVNIITDSDNINHMKLDGSDISSKFTSVPSKPEYSYARIEVEHGSHTISNINRSEYSGFVAHIYGLGEYESYAYSVGSMAINLSSQLILNGLSTLDYPEGFDFCINNNDSINFDLKLNYTPTDVIWDFGDGSTGSGAPINHYYEETGKYDVTCKVYKLEDGINKLVSTLSTSLHINPIYDTLIIDTICEGEDYMDYNFNIINPSAGVHNKTQNLSTIYGCDSIVTLNIKVNPTYETTIDETLCQGSNYNKNGFNITDLQSDYTETLTLQTINGCDSIVTLNIKVNDVIETTIDETLCQGSNYNENGFNLTNLQSDYTETLTLQTINGCDSIFNINLKVINKYEDIVIEGIEEISVATNLSTGCYKYTIGEVENHEHYTWEIDNEEWKIIPDNNECIVCATTPDKGTLYVRAENYCGSVYDYIVLNAKFIEDQDNADVRIYPNPITDFVNIQQNDITCINVYDSFGQIVIGNNYNFDNQVTLDLSNLRSSIYIIEIITLEQTFVERIYIKK